MPNIRLQLDSQPARIASYAEAGPMDRDEWLGRMLLCAHPAVPPACLAPALFVWALGMDETTVARSIGWQPLRMAATMRRFARRCRALGLGPSIPHGRDFVVRYRRLLGLIEGLVEQLARTPRDATAALEALARMIESLVDHPLAGSPDAHALRARVLRIRNLAAPMFEASPA